VAPEARYETYEEWHMKGSASVNWGPRKFWEESRGHDFHLWKFSNDSSFLICRKTDDRKNQPDDRRVDGAWVLHWPSNTWTPVTAPSVRAHRVAMFLKPDFAMPSRMAERSVTITANEARFKRFIGEGSIVEVSATPSPDDLLTYRNILITAIVRVDKVWGGEGPTGNIQLSAWVVREGKFTAVAKDWKAGTPIAFLGTNPGERPGLAMEQVANTLSDLSLGDYFALEYSIHKDDDERVKSNRHWFRNLNPSAPSAAP
jgi:hypothetical protein